MTVCSLDFAFLSARFSLSDFPDFFDIDLRGDLSDIIGPSIGNLNGPDASTVRHIQLVPRIVDQHFMTIGGDPTFPEWWGKSPPKNRCRHARSWEGESASLTTRTVTNLSSMNVTKAAPWLIHTQPFDPAGTNIGSGRVADQSGNPAHRTQIARFLSVDEPLPLYSSSGNTHDATAVRLQNDATDSSASHRHKLPPGARPANAACHRKCHCNGVGF